MSRVGVLGSGDVGKVLALGFKKHGHDVRIGSREGNKLAAWSAEHGVAEGTFTSVVEHAEVVVLVVLGRAAEEIVSGLADALAGKVVIDATNPIAAAPPVGGILQYFTGPNESLMERLQKAAPAARFVKAFSSVGNAFMVNPSFPGGTPTMFICGDDADAKRVVTEILASFGWDAEDCGPVQGARAIEPLCQLWCAPGFQRNQWTHAFKLLKL
ncbi:MAG: NAD(P)-binding domain-containing protein [Polyangiales bacterium]